MTFYAFLKLNNNQSNTLYILVYKINLELDNNKKIISYSIKKDKIIEYKTDEFGYIYINETELSKYYDKILFEINIFSNEILDTISQYSNSIYYDRLNIKINENFKEIVLNNIETIVDIIIKILKKNNLISSDEIEYNLNENEFKELIKNNVII